MSRSDYGRFIKTFHLIDDASREIAKLFTEYLFGGGLNIDFWYAETYFQFSIIHKDAENNDVMHSFNLPSEWLVLTKAQADIIISAKTKDELWSYLS